MDGVIATLVSGGPVIGVLLALSLLSLALIAVKLMQLRGALSGDKRRDRAFALWAEGERSAAVAEVAQGLTPADRLLRQAMTGLIAGVPRPALDRDLEWRGNAALADMARHIRLLELIAMVAPLLGLLGTVLGMIRSFQDLALAQGAANAALLAAGIWQALLTTAAGLIVAIPAAIAAGLLASRVDSIGQRIEASIGQLYALEDLQT
jgi:biopolymer transport protein ExbB